MFLTFKRIAFFDKKRIAFLMMLLFIMCNNVTLNYYKQIIINYKFGD